MPKDHEESPETILMITLSAGGGHMQAARGKFKQIQEKNPNTRFLVCDLFIDTFGSAIGKSFNGWWDAPQETGNVSKQEWLRVMGLPLADKLFWLPIFCKMLYILFTNPIDRIIDTQPVATSAIIKALRVFAFFRSKKIAFEKVLTELPSEAATLFFKPIKKLSSEDKKWIRIVCPFASLLDKDKQEAFWKAQCGLSLSSIEYGDPPLRPNFLKLQHQAKIPKDLTLKIFTHSEQESLLIEKAAKTTSLALITESPYLKLTIDAKDTVSIIMLGSRPHEKATLQYVKNFIDLAKQFPHSHSRHLVFVFCRNHRERTNSLLKRVHDIVVSEPNFPENLVILPMPFQDDDVIAPLFFRSDMTLTRSGGITAMELLSVCHGDIWIHTEQLDHKLSKKRALGMPFWEEGNAKHLVKQKGAKFITPDSFCLSCRDLFNRQEQARQASSP